MQNLQGQSVNFMLYFLLCTVSIKRTSKKIYKILNGQYIQKKYCFKHLLLRKGFLKMLEFPKGMTDFGSRLLFKAKGSFCRRFKALL